MFVNIWVIQIWDGLALQQITLQERNYTLSTQPITMSSKFSKLKFKQSTASKLKPFSSTKKKQQPQLQQILQQRQKYKLKDKVTIFPPTQGTGLIVSSGRSINGQGTLFKTQLQKSDTLIITDPITKQTHSRNITLILSNTSLLLQQPFPQDIPSYTPFTIQKKTKVQTGQDLTLEYQRRLAEIKKTKPISKGVMNVRVKKGVWSYETKKVQYQDGMSKEQLLDMREKMGKDKFCW